MNYIYLTNSQYNQLPKVRQDGFFSWYGIPYNDGYIIPAEILDRSQYE